MQTTISITVAILKATAIGIGMLVKVMVAILGAGQPTSGNRSRSRSGNRSRSANGRSANYDTVRGTRQTVGYHSATASPGMRFKNDRGYRAIGGSHRAIPQERYRHGK